MFRRRSLASMLLALSLSMGGATAAFADDDANDDDDDAVSTQPATSHDDHYGAFLYNATCADLANASSVHDLGELDANRDDDDDDDDDLDDWSVLAPDDQTAPADLVSDDDSTDDVSFEDITTGNYAVAVHASDDRDAAVIACGDITGDPVNGIIVIQLHEVEGSGIEGRAAIQSDNDDDDDDNEVRITVGAIDQVQPIGTPAA